MRHEPDLIKTIACELAAEAVIGFTIAHGRECVTDLSGVEVFLCAKPPGARCWEILARAVSHRGRDRMHSSMIGGGLYYVVELSPTRR